MPGETIYIKWTNDFSSDTFDRTLTVSDLQEGDICDSPITARAPTMLLRRLSGLHIRHLRMEFYCIRYFTVSSEVTGQESCEGANDAEIETTVTNGSGTYHYSIDGGLITQSNPIFDNLAPGEYAVFVKDGSSCAVESEVITIEPKVNPTWYAHLDDDGYGDESNSVNACERSTGYVEISGDCDDGNGSVYPGAPALPDGLDNNRNDTIDKISQTITLEAIGDHTDDGSTFDVACSSSSGLEVTIEIEGPLSLEGHTAAITGAGMVTITATQPGSTGYLSADTVMETFCINPVPEITMGYESAQYILLESNYESGNQWYLNEEIITGATQMQHEATESGNYTLEVSIDECSAKSKPAGVIISSLEDRLDVYRLQPGP